MRILGTLKADKDSEAGAPPSRELLERMGSFIEEITKAGVMLATDGLQPSSKGKRVRLADGKITVIDGPFTESKELIASYALFEVKSMDEAVEVDHALPPSAWERRVRASTRYSRLRTSPAKSSPPSRPCARTMRQAMRSEHGAPVNPRPDRPRAELARADLRWCDRSP